MRDYEPYGEVLAQQGGDASGYGYTGEMFDTQTGLVFLRARYYSPMDGRFISKDSWGGNYSDPITLNRWNYALSNPILYTDPSGNISPQYCASLLALALVDGPVPVFDILPAACLVLAGGTFALTWVLSQQAPNVAQEIDTICKTNWIEWLYTRPIAPDSRQRPTPQPLPVPNPIPLKPGTPEPPSLITSYRELDGGLSSDRTYFKKPETNPGQFREDLDGMSTFEMESLPGVKPYALGFVIQTKFPITPGITGSIIDLPTCSATFTPEHGEGKKHWSIRCMGNSLSQTISQWAKGSGKGNIIINPTWIGEPSERRLP